MITIISNFKPKIEKQHIWGYTEEDIIARWKLWQEWDALYRLFGEADKNPSYQAKTTIPKPNINKKALEKLLDKM